MNRLFLKKLLLAFLLGSVPTFLTGMIAILAGDVEVDITSWQGIGLAVLSIIAGAAAAGLRALLAGFTDWMPTDALHGPGATATEVVVTKDS